MLFRSIAFLETVCKDQVSYKAMVSTTTNGYGAVVSRREYYEIDRFLTDSAKAIREQRAVLYRSKEEEVKKRRIQQEQEEKEKRFNQYWEEHAEEKAALEAEKLELTEKIDTLQKEIDAIPSKLGLDVLDKRIETITQEKSALGLFKFKERKELQEQIDALDKEVRALSTQVYKEQSPFLDELQGMKKRIRSIETELTKER